QAHTAAGAQGSPRLIRSVRRTWDEVSPFRRSPEGSRLRCTPGCPPDGHRVETERNTEHVRGFASSRSRAMVRRAPPKAEALHAHEERLPEEDARQRSVQG